MGAGTPPGRVPLVAIPKDWVQASSVLTELREQMPLGQNEWSVVIRWLTSSKFDEIERDCVPRWRFG